jgi:hypothetical protein
MNHKIDEIKQNLQNADTSTILELLAEEDLVFVNSEVDELILCCLQNTNRCSLTDTKRILEALVNIASQMPLDYQFTNRTINPRGPYLLYTIYAIEQLIDNDHSQALTIDHEKLITFLELECPIKVPSDESNSEYDVYLLPQLEQKVYEYKFQNALEKKEKELVKEIFNHMFARRLAQQQAEKLNTWVARAPCVIFLDYLRDCFCLQYSPKSDKNLKEISTLFSISEIGDILISLLNTKMVESLNMAEWDYVQFYYIIFNNLFIQQPGLVIELVNYLYNRLEKDSKLKQNIDPLAFKSLCEKLQNIYIPTCTIIPLMNRFMMIGIFCMALSIVSAIVGAASLFFGITPILIAAFAASAFFAVLSLALIAIGAYAHYKQSTVENSLTGKGAALQGLYADKFENTEIQNDSGSSLPNNT